MCIQSVEKCSATDFSGLESVAVQPSMHTHTHTQVKCGITSLTTPLGDKCCYLSELCRCEDIDVDGTDRGQSISLSRVLAAESSNQLSQQIVIFTHILPLARNHQSLSLSSQQVQAVVASRRVAGTLPSPTNQCRWNGDIARIEHSSDCFPLQLARPAAVSTGNTLTCSVSEASTKFDWFASAAYEPSHSAKNIAVDC